MRGELYSREGKKIGVMDMALPKPPQGKTQPHSEEAEKAVLSALIFDAQAMQKIYSLLLPQDFYNQAHGGIYEAIVALWTNNEPVDLITLREKLSAKGKLEDVGGVAYLVELSGMSVGSSNIVAHAIVIKQYAFRRAMLGFSAYAYKAAHDETEDHLDVLGDLSSKLDELRFLVSNSGGRGGYALMETTERAFVTKIDSIKEKGQAGISTGIAGFDERTGGLMPDDYMVIMAKSGDGKTALALSIARSALEHGHKVVHIDLEMDTSALGNRLIAAKAKIPHYRLRSRPDLLTEQEWDRLREASNWFVSAPIQVLNMQNTKDLSSIDVLEQEIKAMVRADACDMVIIDSINLVSVGKMSEGDSIPAASTRLKRLQLSLNVPFVVLAQMNQDQSKRQDTGGDAARPKPSDLRYSQKPYQDSSICMGLWEPFAAGIETDSNNNSIAPIYDSIGEPCNRVMVLSAVKGRNGLKAQDYWMEFDAEMQSFTPWRGAYGKMSEPFQAKLLDVDESSRLDFKPGNADLFVEPRSHLEDDFNSPF